MVKIRFIEFVQTTWFVFDTSPIINITQVLLGYTWYDIYKFQMFKKNIRNFKLNKDIYVYNIYIGEVSNTNHVVCTNPTNLILTIDFV